ncbi:MAG: thioredoxin family protein [Bacillota bacterium]
MQQFDKENFAVRVLASPEPVVVDFWSPKCDPCLALMPDMEALARRYEGKARFGKVNILENRRLAISQKVLGVPNISLYVGGGKVAELTGDDIASDAVEEALKRLLY